jgi:hypothetical protein
VSWLLLNCRNKLLAVWTRSYLAPVTPVHQNQGTLRFLPLYNHRHNKQRSAALCLWTAQLFQSPNLLSNDFQTIIILRLMLTSPVTVAGGLRHVLFSLARKPGSWVRIPHKAWMFGICMCSFCVRVVLCLARGLATSWSLVQRVLPSAKWTKWKKKKTLHRKGIRVKD